jgi:phosphatidate cytidylyltransferase
MHDPAGPHPGAAPAAAMAAPKPKRSRWSLALRIASGVLFVPLLILLARLGGVAFVGFVAVQVALGLREFYAMMRGRGVDVHAGFGTLTALGLLWTCYRPWGFHPALLAAIAVLVLLVLGLRRPERPNPVESAGVTALGVLYVGWLSAHLVLLRELPWAAGTDYLEGARYVLLAFFVTWSCDTGAFAIGSVWGRHRPWAAISPRKSVEGSVAGFVMAVVAAFVARAWFAPFLAARDAAILGAVVGVVAQVGDLAESLLKRHSRHGDSSDLIPGHGGVLDRFDSLYFAAPVVYYYLRVVVFGVP